MKKFISYFKDFHRDYFSVSLYFLIALFIGVLIVFNYTFNFEKSVINSYYGKPVRMFYFFLYHAVAYYGVLLIIWIHDKNKIEFTRKFWIKSLIGMAILGIDRGVFPFISDLLISDVPTATYRFYFKVLFNFYGFITIVLSLLLVKLIFDRKTGEGLYGLSLNKTNINAYFILLAIMVPVVYIGTYLPGFLEYYPTYKRSGGFRFASFYNFSEWVSVVIFEFFYLIDFLNTELLFRGFMVIGLSKLLGKNVVLPMAATYAVLHFGKPWGETVSSVFGGYLLGILALYSRNIWGGVFIHGGIALLMELFAFLRQPG